MSTSSDAFRSRFWLEQAEAPPVQDPSRRRPPILGPRRLNVRRPTGEENKQLQIWVGGSREDHTRASVHGSTPLRLLIKVDAFQVRERRWIQTPTWLLASEKLLRPCGSAEGVLEEAFKPGPQQDRRETNPKVPFPPLAPRPELIETLTGQRRISVGRKSPTSSPSRCHRSMTVGDSSAVARSGTPPNMTENILFLSFVSTQGLR